jgi:hypothetical protein
VRVQRQELAAEVAAGAAQLPPGDLELLGLGHGVRLPEVVDDLIGGQEGQAVGQFQALVAQRAVLAQGRPAQGGFVNQMQGQVGAQRVGLPIARPGAQQVPGTQTQVFGDQQPHPQKTTRDLVGP